MNVKGFLKDGRRWVKMGALATQGKTIVSNEMSDDAFYGQLYPRHSTIEEFNMWFECITSKRAYTHIVRHKELGKYVNTSRPELRAKQRAPKGYKFLALRFNAKRLMEVCEDRLCFESHVDTIKLMNMIKTEAIKIDHCFKTLLYPRCVWYDFCPHIRSDCKYHGSSKWNLERSELLSIPTLLREKKKKAENIIR
jgi:hypothetical protein